MLQQPLHLGTLSHSAIVLDTRRAVHQQGRTLLEHGFGLLEFRRVLSLPLTSGLVLVIKRIDALGQEPRMHGFLPAKNKKMKTTKDVSSLKPKIYCYAT